MKKLIGLGLFLVLTVNPLTLAWFAGRYVVADDLEPSDAVLYLRGNPDEERVRMEEAARLVQKRYAPLLLVSVDSKPFYGQPMRKLVETFLRQRGFPPEKLRFCENNADFTAEEAQALLSCLKQLRAKQAIVVTSEYHTRRSRFLFRRVFSGSEIAVLVHPVYNSAYWDPHWWRRRRWAKTFLIESLAQAWSRIEQFSPFRGSRRPAAEKPPAAQGQ